MTHFSTTQEWLNWLSIVNPFEICLGLERVQFVASKLDLLQPCHPVITVAGTNGKGSTVAGLSAIYQKAGYRVGCFTSPFLFTPHEQIQINDVAVTDSMLCAAFEAIDHTRGEVVLTAFEFFTLAALLIFKRYALDVMILEVGLGGRLDAVNILDASLAIITSIGIDHTEWLGHTREAIAYEKAGIFRPYQQAVCGDAHPPCTLLEHAQHLDVQLYCRERDFSFQEQSQQWSFTHSSLHFDNLPRTPLATQNMATVLMAVSLMQPQLAVTRQAIDAGLKEVSLPGRIQVMKEGVTKIFDVSHNPDSVSLLAQTLKGQPWPGKTYAVFSMLADKDIQTSIREIHEMIDEWYVAPIQSQRSASLETLKLAFAQTENKNVHFFPELPEAYAAAMLNLQLEDRLLIFGSFHTVAEVWQSTLHPGLPCRKDSST